MNRKVVWAIGAVLLPLSGCVQPGIEVELGEPTSESAPWAFSAPVVARACSGCGEATIAWDANGTLLATSASGLEFARSTDDGSNWTAFSIDYPMVFMARVQGDAQLQTAPDGTIWFSIIRIAAGGTAGARVMSTSDGGLTWDTDTWVETNLNPVVNAPDRQWLGFSDDEVLLFCICTAAVEPAIFASSDGTDFVFRDLVVPPTQRATPWGMPAVFPDGTIHWPYVSGKQDQPGLPGSALYTATQGDIGWTNTVVQDVGSAPKRGAFPTAARNDTHVAVTWNGHDGTAWHPNVAFYDGETWSDPIVLEESESWIVHPWIEALPDGRWALMHYDDSSDNREVVLTLLDDRGAIEQANLGAVTGSTDLPHFAVGPDGRVAAVWVDGRGVVVSVQDSRGTV